jgi:hypothetical protein
VKSLLSISVLFFYLSVSIGVHVDVDTCCKSIAGLSVFTEEGVHSINPIDDCCAQEAISHCDPSEHDGTQGCPSDCVFIQILQQAPQVSIAQNISVLPLELTPYFSLISECETCIVQETQNWNSESPRIALSEDLYRIHGAFITYS